MSASPPPSTLNHSLTHIFVPSRQTQGIDVFQSLRKTISLGANGAAEQRLMS